MNPPNWHARKPRTCPCDDCHIQAYPDLAYAMGKNADTEWEGSPDSYGTEDMPKETT